MVSLRLCAEFSLFTDNTPLPSTFTLAGFTFTSAGNIFVNQTGARKGAQFEDVGLRVELPRPLPSVHFVLGTFGGYVDAVARDSNGAQVAGERVPGNNIYNNVHLTGQSIATLELLDGGNEAILAEICVTFDCSAPGAA